MSAKSALKKFQLEATCYICSGYFIDPVVLDCGHNFCHTCLFDCWRDFFKDFACPQCPETPGDRNIIQNKHLAGLVDLIKQLSDAFSQIAGEVPVCQQHQVQEPLKLFCKNDLIPLCSVCEQSLEHQAHVIVPVEEAAEEYKHCLSRCIEPLKEEREKMLVHKQSIEEDYQGLVRETKAGKKKMKEYFKKLHEFLVLQESLLKTKFQTLLGEIRKKRSECFARIFKDIVSCNRIILELEEKCQQPVCEFLQDVKGTMERFMKSTSSEDRVPFALELKWESLELCDVNPLLEAVINQFKDILRPGYLQFKASITLDAETAHPRLILSLKDVRLGDEDQDVPMGRKRFNECLFVLGCAEYSAGRYSWDVLVGSEEDWAVGVAKKSVRRKGPVSLSPQAGIWAVGKQEGQYVFFNPPTFPRLHLNAELKRIRVFLNCEGRRVTFFDADTAAFLFATFITATTRESFLPFFHLPNGGHLTIVP